ncbi:pantetheine-phosphate adenylyltransferase [Elusimicrobiota bacterium]
MHKNIIAVYPGSFDPITNGHIDIVKRSLAIFGKLIVAVNANTSKIPLFPVRERIHLVKTALKEKNLHNRVIVEEFKGLAVDYLKTKKAKVIIRGLRFVSDFEYEFQMALMNRHLLESIETVFMMPDDKYVYLSSSIVKEISRHGRPPKDFIPKCVEKAIMKKLEVRS